MVVDSAFSLLGLFCRYQTTLRELQRELAAHPVKGGDVR